MLLSTEGEPGLETGQEMGRALGGTLKRMAVAATRKVGALLLRNQTQVVAPDKIETAADAGVVDPCRQKLREAQRTCVFSRALHVVREKLFIVICALPLVQAPSTIKITKKYPAESALAGVALAGGYIAARRSMRSRARRNDDEARRLMDADPLCAAEEWEGVRRDVGSRNYAGVRMARTLMRSAMDEVEVPWLTTQNQSGNLADPPEERTPRESEFGVALRAVRGAQRDGEITFAREYMSRAYVPTADHYQI